MTDFPDWTDQQAAANDISVTGAPLLRKTGVLANANPANIPAGGSINPVALVSINQPSFEIAFGINLPAGVGTVPFCQIVMQWVDASTGIVTDTEVFLASAGNGAGNGIQYYLSGPARGSSLNLLFENLDPAQIMTIGYIVAMTSHVHAYDRLTQFAYSGAAPIGFSNPAGNPNTGVLAVINANIGANGTVSRLCAVWNGTVTLDIDNTGQADSISVTIEDPQALYSTVALSHLYKFFVAAGATVTTNITLPHGPVLIVIANNAANAIQPTVTLIRTEY
jgi:hypothetical protein